MAWWAGGIGAILTLLAAAPSRGSKLSPSLRLRSTPEEAARAFADYLLPSAKVGAWPATCSVTPFELFVHWRRMEARPDLPARAEDLACAWADQFGHAKKIVVSRAGGTWREGISVDEQPGFELGDVCPERAEGTIVLALRCQVDDVYLWGKPQIDPGVRYLVRIEVVLCRIGDAWLVESPFPAEDACGEVGA